MRDWVRKTLKAVGLYEFLHETQFGPPIQAFKFQCDMCGLDLVGPVPEPGTFVKIGCRCGHEHRMFWTGKFWQYKVSGKDSAPFPISSMPMEEAVKQGVEALQRKKSLQDIQDISEVEGGAYKPSD